MTNRRRPFSTISFAASQCLSLAIAGLWFAACGSSEKGTSSDDTGGNGTSGALGTVGAGKGGASNGVGGNASGTLGSNGTGGTGGAGTGGTSTSAGREDSGGSNGNGAGGAIGTAGADKGGASTATGGGASGSSGSNGDGGNSTSGNSAKTGGRSGNAGAVGTGGTGKAGASNGTGGGLSGGPAGSSTGGGVNVGAAGSGTGGSSSSAQCPATATATSGEKTISITVGTLTRSFVRHVPTGYTGKTPVPVVIDFHPKGSSASSWKSSTSWGTLADQKGFIVLWPDGIGSSWNAGRVSGTAAEQNVDDVAFTRAMLTTLAKDACVDARRVYATGCSNGGGMTYKVACEAADVIAAVAPVDFDCVTNSVDRPSCGNCAPARPISEIQFRGTADAMAQYDGGVRAGGTTNFPGALQNFADWGGINQCTGTPAAMSNHPACQAYPTCEDGVMTALCTVQNGSHCGSYDSFGIVDIAWETFQKNALP